MKRCAVFLDRDGVINDSVVRDGRPFPPHSLEELVVDDEVLPALSELKAAGFILICCTNQPDVGRGTQTAAVVEEIHNYLRSFLPLDDIFVCFDSEESSQRKKPNPGMLIEAAERYGIDLSRSYMIGDRWRDVEAGRRAGCTAIFIDLGYTEPWPVAPPTHKVTSLKDAAKLVLSLRNGEN